MKQNLNSSRKLGTFLSPEINQEKGWSSERVQNPLSNNIRRMSGLSPFYSGRATPSKWDDAERWISSPVFGYGVAKYSSQSKYLQPHRRPKSKSGPIVPPWVGYGSNFGVNSPFSTGVLMPRGMGTHCNGGLIGEQSVVARSISGIDNGWSNLASDCSSPCSQDEIPDNDNGDGNVISRVISRRDMATQRSPEGSKSSSPLRSSSPLSNCPGDNPSKLKIREVQVDKRAVISETSRNHSLLTKKRTEETREFDFSDPVSGISTLDVDASSKYSKFRREEAKITAWENLQKAKAEAAIRKLEMKLEKERASFMDKILKKLRVAQNKAQEMRSSISTRQEPQIPWKQLRFSVFHRHKRFSSWSCCFSTHGSSS